LGAVNFNEAIELLEVVSDFHFKASEKKPDFCIYDNQNEGYVLCVKALLINAEYRNYLKEIVESRKLGIRESEGYLIIYGP
jgi:hypothetical protein